MGGPRAYAITCSVVLLLSACSTPSAAADEVRAVTGAVEAYSTATIIREQSRFLPFANVILPEMTRAQPVPPEPLFAKPTWLMPLPDFAAGTMPTEQRPIAVRLRTANVAALDPADRVGDGLRTPGAARLDNEPFGIPTARAPQGLLWIKWRKVQRAIKAEAPSLARCRATASHCSPAQARFVAIVAEAAKRHGRTRLELVNQRINYAIRYVSDWKQWHRADVWSAPLDNKHKGSFDTGMGDCEDYAIAKYVALRDAGMPARDLRLLVVRDKSVHSYHAVLAARQNGRWLLLDNRWRRLIPDDEARFFRPLFALNAAGVERFAAARANNRRSRIKRLAKRIATTPGRIVFAGEPGLTRGNA